MDKGEVNESTANPVKKPWYLSTWFIVLVFIVTFMFTLGIPAIILAIVRFVKYKENRVGSVILMGSTIAIPTLLIAIGILGVILTGFVGNGEYKETQKEVAIQEKPKEEVATQEKPKKEKPKKEKPKEEVATQEKPKKEKPKEEVATQEKSKEEVETQKNPKEEQEQAAKTTEEKNSSEGQTKNNEGEYIFSDSNSRYLSEEEIRNVDADKLKIARNEIFARHGYIFNDEELNQYFNSTSWYQGTVRSDQFNMDWVLNDFEKKNVELISLVENSGRKSSAQTGETLSDADVVGGYANITEIAENLIENHADIAGQRVAFCGWGFYHDSEKIELHYFEGENSQPLVTAYYDSEKIPTMSSVEPFDMANTIVWGTVRGISDDYGIEIDLDAVNVCEQDLWFIEYYAQDYREVSDAYEARAAEWGGKLTLEGTVQVEDGQKYILILDNGDRCILWGVWSEQLSSVGEIAIYESFKGLRVKVYGKLADASPTLLIDYIAPIIQ